MRGYEVPKKYAHMQPARHIWCAELHNLKVYTVHT
jgi:hypothetical protein